MILIVYKFILFTVFRSLSFECQILVLRMYKIYKQTHTHKHEPIFMYFKTFGFCDNPLTKNTNAQLKMFCPAMLRNV